MSIAVLCFRAAATAYVELNGMIRRYPCMCVLGVLSSSAEMWYRKRVIPRVLLCYSWHVLVFIHRHIIESSLQYYEELILICCTAPIW